MEVEAVVTGARETSALIQRLERRLTDGSSQAKGLVDTLLEIEQERFAGRGVRWRKQSKETRRIDAQQGRDPRPLILTRQLMRSLTQRSGAGQVVQIMPSGVRFGTRIFYARFQKGLGRNPVGASRQQRLHLVAELRDLLLG